MHVQLHQLQRSASTTAPVKIYCAGGGYCDGTLVPPNTGYVGGPTVCGANSNQYACNLVNGTPTWQTTGATCATGMPHACTTAPTTANLT